MRATRIVSGFIGWRWAPCCALIAGSLLFVALIVLVVPDSLGKLPGAVAAPVVPQTDMLDSDALGQTPSRPPQHMSTPALHAPGLPRMPTTPTTPRTTDIAVPEQTPPVALPRAVEARAAEIHASLPARTARPTPGAAPREEEPAPAPPDDAPPPEDPKPSVPPRPALHTFMGRLHILAPHMTAPGVRKQPVENSNAASADEAPR